MSGDSRIVELPSGKSALLRAKLTWGLRCDIEDASRLPSELLDIYAHVARPGMGDDEIEAAAQPLLVPHVGTLARMNRAVDQALVLAWVESCGDGPITETVLRDLDEADAQELIAAARKRESASRSRNAEGPDGVGDPLSPSVAVTPSGSSSVVVAASGPAS